MDMVSATRDIAASPAEVWALLTDPARHPETDASGMVGQAVDGRIAQVGDTFTIAMGWTGPDGARSEYHTENHVSRCNPTTDIAWRTAVPGEEPFGWEWRYQLQPLPDGGTRVRLSQDYSACSPQVRERFGLPFLSDADLAASLERLAGSLC